MSLLDDVLKRWRERILARDAETLAILSNQWGSVERSLRSEINALADEWVELERSGERPSPSGAAGPSTGSIQRMRRLRELERQAQRVIGSYQSWAQGLIEGGQRDYWQMGERFAEEAVSAQKDAISGQLSAVSKRRKGEEAVMGAEWNRLNVTAANEMVGMAGDGSPLFDVLQKRALPGASLDGIVNALASGVGMGWNPSKTAQAIQDGLMAGLSKALQIARTEQLRAYRSAAVLSYQANGDILAGYEWVSACDSRTCAACWGMHGKFFSLDEERPNDHVCGRCSYVPVLKDASGNMEIQSGAERFGRLSENGQRNVLGPAKWAAWKEGRLTINDHADTGIAQLQKDATWGRTNRERSLSELGLDYKEYLERSKIRSGTNKIVFSDGKNQIIGITGDFRKYYKVGTPGRDYLIPNKIEVTATKKDHIVRDHNSQISWMENNIAEIQKALEDPNYIDAEPKGKENRWTITHVLELKNDNFDLLVIGIRYGKPNENHRIITMFKADMRFVYDTSGGLKPRWLKIK